MPEDRTTRLLAMQQQLMCGNTIRKAAAATAYGVSPKSIQRDLEALRAFYAERGNELIYDREADTYRLQRGAGRLQNIAGEPRFCRGGA